MTRYLGALAFLSGALVSVHRDEDTMAYVYIGGAMLLLVVAWIIDVTAEERRK